MCIHPNRYTKRSGQSKICQFDDSLAINEEVLWFEISVQYSPLVAEQNALEELVCVTL